MQSAGKARTAELPVVDLASVPNSFSDLSRSLYVYFDRLRERSPVVWTSSGEEGWYTFLRAESAMRILSDCETFKTYHPDAAASGYFDDELLPASKDPPEHQKYRRPMQGSFGPRAIKALEPYMRACARNLIGKLAPRGACEFICEFAQPYPAQIFFELMKFPEEGRDELIRHEHAFWTSATADPGGEIRQGAMQGLRDYVTRQIALKRAHPDDSLLSVLLKTRVDDRPLSDAQVVSYGVLACIGGIHTTRSLLGKIVCHLALHPPDKERLLQDTTLARRFADEALRVYAIGESFRFVARDVVLDGCALSRGDRISINWPSVNRDPRMFPEPDRIHFDGPAPQHLGFGHGAHFCVGMHLARTDVAIAVEEWLHQIPHFELEAGTQAVEQVWGGAGLEALRLCWKV